MDKKVAVIGAGPMGLVAAYELLKKGYEVDIYEKEGDIGGMSVHFDFGGLDIEMYYHFVCGPDNATFDMMKELGIYDKLKWTETKMGFFYNGKLYKWGGPFELLKFPEATLMEKIRYGLHVFCASKMKNWKALDKTTALNWIRKWEGEKGYQKFWKSLFHLKFYELKELIATPWLWSRLVRVSKSRKSLFQEKMGYIVGGSKTFTYRLKDEIERLGGKIHLNASVSSIEIDGNITKGITVNNSFLKFKNVISTIPIQYLPAITKGLPKSDTEMLFKVDNVGVVCVIAKVSKAVTDNFWLNITDDNFDIPGIIEISNLNVELEEKVIYAPFYLHKNNPMYSYDDKIFIEKVKGYIKKINPTFTDKDIIDIRVFKYEYAQPVCTLEFLTKLPPTENSERKGFYFADTAYCYPEDRSIQESIIIAKKLVDILVKNEVS